MNINYFLNLKKLYLNKHRKINNFFICFSIIIIGIKGSENPESLKENGNNQA
jgi:hypothetical protein